MNFGESTQRQNWLFTADQLRKQREENRQRGLDALQQARARNASASAASLDTLDSQSSAPAEAAPEPPSLDEELGLLKYYASKLQHACRELRLPRRVLGTALTYLKRIYVSHSCLEHDPQQLLLTCLYLACKIEEHYISAAELGRLTGAPAELILRTELTALQGLKFDLIVYSPYKSIDGFLEDVRGAAADAEAAAGPSASAEAVAAAAAAAGLDSGMSSLADEQLDKVRAAAYSAADALMLSDAPLLHTPGRLALAALRSGFGKLGIKLQQYVQRVAQRGSSADSGGDAQSAAQQLQAALTELDQLGAEGARSVDQAQMAALDRKLKACRTVLQGDGASAAAAKAKAKADKQARKAAKAAEQRRAAEAAVGILPDPPAAAAAGVAAAKPPSKRARTSDE